MTLRPLAVALVAAVATAVGCQTETPAGAPASGGDAGASSCAPPAVDCGGACVDVRLARESCGACGKACAAAEVCSEGRCGTTCSGGTTRCGERCVETAVDRDHCGRCGERCGAAQRCAAGTCVCEGPGLATCGGTCVDTQSDPAHCGRCDSPCAAGQECSAGTCKGPVAEWRFDGTLADAVGRNSGAPDGPIAYDDLSWSAGRGKALRLDGASSVVVAAPSGLPLAATPRTIEAWVRPIGAQRDATYNGILSYGVRTANQGQLLSVQSNGWASSANWNNDLVQSAGTRVVSAFTHVAFTWDGARRRLYIDGEEVASDAPPPFSTAAGELRIGSTDTPGRLFAGAIDDVRIWDHARPAARLRASATTDVVYRFDPGTQTADSGPNRTTVGNKSATGVGTSLGRNQLLDGAVYLDGARGTSFVIGPVQALGKRNRPYTMMIWLEPAVASAVVAHVSSQPDGLGWCMPMLALRGGKPSASSWRPGLSTATADRDVTLGTWIHVATSWSPGGGLKLYVDGVLEETVAQEAFAASEAPAFVTLGSHGAGGECAGAGLAPFKGAVDDFKVFDRELSPAEILAAMSE